MPIKKKNNNMKYILAQYFMLRLGNITCRLDHMGQKDLNLSLTPTNNHDDVYL